MPVKIVKALKMMDQLYPLQGCQKRLFQKVLRPQDF